MRAAVHQHREPSFFRALSGGSIDDAELEPDSGGADRDGFVDVLARLVATAEHVDDVDRERHVSQGWVDLFAENLTTRRMDRNDAFPLAL